MKFYSNNCAPCDAMLPVREKVKKILAEKWCDIKFCDILTDRNDIASDYGIRAVPTIILEKHSKWEFKRVKYIGSMANSDEMVEFVLSNI